MGKVFFLEKYQVMPIDFVIELCQLYGKVVSQKFNGKNAWTMHVFSHQFKVKDSWAFARPFFFLSRYQPPFQQKKKSPETITRKPIRNKLIFSHQSDKCGWDDDDLCNSEQNLFWIQFCIAFCT